MSREEYDFVYSDTGSSNISRATPEYAEVIREAKRTLQPDEYLIHRATAIINAQVKAGTPWSKCVNCGSPFIVKGSSEICSEQCHREYLEYLSFNK